MNESYWQRLTLRRLSRRRVITGALAGVSGGLALPLLGCSPPGADGVPTPAGASLQQPVNTTDVAKPGGAFKGFIVNDAQSFDPLASSSVATLTQVAAYTYPRLMKFGVAVYPEVARGNVEGDIVEGIEINGDRTLVTMRLRQGQAWEQKAPTNGRNIDAADVMFSWNKFAKASPFRHEAVYSADAAPGAPVESVTSPDARTLVFKLKFPDAAFLSLLASDRLFYVMPRESEGGFDPRLDTRGYGPWLMTDNRPGLFRGWTKNPNYYFKGRPFPDKLEQIVVGDYTSRLAQFRAGLIWPSVASQDDLIPTRRELPDLLLRQSGSYATSTGSLAFGYDNESPWRDERLRQAASYLIDRETLIDLKTDRARFEAEGLPVSARYHTAVAAGWEDAWTDPLDTGRFGSDGRYFRYEPDRARKLMEAAGFPDGVETSLHYNGGNEYTPAYSRTAELLSGMLQEGNVRARLEPHDFQSDWQPNYNQAYASVANAGRQTRGYAGIIYRTMTSYPSFITQAFSIYHRQGQRFIGMTQDAKNARDGDPEVNGALERLRREFDEEKRRTQALEFAQLMARKSYDIPMLPHAPLNYSLTWPCVANQGVHRGWPGGTSVTEANIHLWIDTSKAPLKSS